MILRNAVLAGEREVGLNGIFDDHHLLLGIFF